ncbi:hypothetical protein OUZ56_017268 [Daphnia magna]|uniref:Uncharacterized protein n=1 Tax=Daphnia magna TaxID=35525 RepID=A0ABR0ASR0_9CRUS|nr:hypothetical protein OUZ56_017268 [Daphnia magna]
MKEPRAKYSHSHDERLLTSQKNINKRRHYAFLEPWLGNGLLLSSDRIKCLLELVSSDADVEIRFRPVLTISVCQSKENDANVTGEKVPPRFELGLPDSESGVLTITPWDRRRRALILMCAISGVVVTSKALIAVIRK